MSAVNIIACIGLIGEDNAIGLNAMYISYLKRIAEGGSTTGYIMLGDCYCRGTGTKRDPAEAIHWYQKAADNGEPFGYECIAMMYYEGKGLAVDYEQAFNYFSKQEDKSACSYYTLGEMYRLGQYVKKDPEKAKMYYEKIAYCDDPTIKIDSYHPMACERLGISPETEENKTDSYSGDGNQTNDDSDSGVKDENPDRNKESLSILGFWHEYDPFGFLSNWYQAGFELAGKRYANVEQYFMYQKAILFKEYDLADQIMNTEDPAKCKELSRRHFDNFDAELWEKVSYRIMRRGVKAKFEQNRDLCKGLLITGNSLRMRGRRKLFLNGIRGQETLKLFRRIMMRFMRTLTL